MPAVGDFNGDGIDEIAIFYKGEWYIDLNGNGIWDEEDLWAKLGTEADQPVVGDWNADGTEIAKLPDAGWRAFFSGSGRFVASLDEDRVLLIEAESGARLPDVPAPVEPRHEASTPWPIAAGRLGMVRMTGASPISLDRRAAE